MNDNIIAKGYNKIKEAALGIWKNISPKNSFNEDIFHDTILKCIERFKDEEIDESTFNRYFYSSFKTNIYRERQYARNRNTELTEKHDDRIIEFIQHNYDKELLEKLIKTEFGNDTFKCCSMLIEGYSVKDIEEETGIKGIYYIINKVRKFLEPYKDELILG